MVRSPDWTRSYGPDGEGAHADVEWADLDSRVIWLRSLPRRVWILHTVSEDYTVLFVCAQPMRLWYARSGATPDGVVIRVQAPNCRSDGRADGHDAADTCRLCPGLCWRRGGSGEKSAGWNPRPRDVPFAVGCGSCPQCLNGNQHICDDYFQPGFTAWGSFAQFVGIRYADTNLVHLPPEIAAVTAASLGCRFITSFRAVVDQGRLKPGEWVVVHGCGGVGLSAIMIAAAQGASVIGVDINDNSLALASAAGARYTINTRSQDRPLEAIHTLTGGGAHFDRRIGSLRPAKSLLSLASAQPVQGGDAGGDSGQLCRWAGDCLNWTSRTTASGARYP